MKSYSFLEVTFTVLDHVSILLSVLAGFGQFWWFSVVLEKIKKSKLADLRWLPFQNMT